MMCLRELKQMLTIKIMGKILLITIIINAITTNAVQTSSSPNQNNESENNFDRSTLLSRPVRQSSAYGNPNDAFLDPGPVELELQPNNIYNYNNYNINFQEQQQKHNEVNYKKVNDNHKPAFKDCKSYNPVVKEELPPGAFVIQVKAEDVDDDEIEYKFVLFVGERERFRLDSKTGVITTQYTFDRDEPIREKEIYITVRATDDGKPKLDDVCTFKVTIEDVNDNPPVFDKVKYDERMSEDRKVGQIVTRITASDLDDGDNSYIEYEIIKEKDYEYFNIDKETGNLFLARSIDRRPEDSYTITVRASNVKSVEQEQETQTEVRIRVVGSSLRAPQFIHTSGDEIKLKENFNEYQKKLFSLSAMSNVDGKPDVVFELLNGRTEQTNSKKTFVGDQQKNDFSIMLGKSLDYETTTDYTLTVVVRNVHLLSAEYTIRVTVEDVNDCIPFYTEVKTGTVLENEAVGTQVMQVQAFDMDGTSANNIVSFELVDNKEFFKIDEQTGNITTLVKFDREERDTYNVKVIVTDNSPSALYKTGKPNQGQQVFAITIGDKNDHEPKFKHDEYIANTVNTHFIVKIIIPLEYHDNRY